MNDQNESKVKASHPTYVVVNSRGDIIKEIAYDDEISFNSGLIVINDPTGNLKEIYRLRPGERIATV